MEEVRCELKYSGVGDAFLALAAAGTAAIVAVAPFPAEARAAALAWLALMVMHARRSMANASSLRLDSSRAIAVRGPGGGWRSGTLRDGCFVAPWLTIVRWRPQGTWLDRTLVILPGMAPPEAMRKIRVILKWS